MPWIKLHERNNWGHVTVHLGGPVVGGRYGTTLPDNECPPTMQAGPYRVRWPDGFEETLTVIMRTYSDTVHDMGHAYDVSGRKPYFVLELHGAKFEKYVMSLPVEIWVES